MIVGNFLCSIQRIKFIVNSVFVFYFSVGVLVIKLSLLHPVFKLFLSGVAENFCQRITKINNPYFLTFGRSGTEVAYVGVRWDIKG